MIARERSRKFGGWKIWLAIAAGLATAALLVSAARPAQSAIASAKSAESFVDSVGVNTHLNYSDTAYGDYPLIRDKLTALGVRHIRDSAHLTSDANYNNIIYDRYKDLASRGVKANLVVDPRSPNLRSVDADKVRRIAEMAGGSLESFEGPNEYDLSGDNDWANVLRNYQKGLYGAVKDNASTKDVPAIGPSLTSEGAYTTLGDLSTYMDSGNVHNYYGGRNPGTGGWGDNGYGSIGWNLGVARKSSGDKPVISTETGYHNVVPSPNGHLGTPEAVAGRYMPRVYLEHFNRGILRTYAYEFIDEKPDPDNRDPEQHFGMLRNDGTEKPAFAALANLLGLLEEPQQVGSSFTPGSLDYSLSGDTTDVHRTLLQKRDGRFYLILWVEKPSWDPNTRQESPVPEQRVTLTLNQNIEKAATYRPNDSATATKQYTSPTQMTLDVPDHPLVVELAPPASGGGSTGEVTTCATGEYMAEYHANQTLDGAPTFKRCEDTIDNDWGFSDGPGNGVGPDNFSVRWRGTHQFEAGSYTFTTTADDGVRMWVDNELIIDGWKEQAATTYTATRTLTAGPHEVKMDYYENGRAAVAKASWQKADGGDTTPPGDPPPPNTAPTITSPSPTPGSVTRDRKTRIAATVRDAETDLTKSDITLSVDGQDTTSFSYDPATDGLSYTSGRLSKGTHTVRVVAKDEQDLPKTRTWSFRVW